MSLKWWSLFVNLNDVIKWQSTYRAAFAPLSTTHACKIMTTWDECSIALCSVTNLARFCRIYLILLLLSIWTVIVWANLSITFSLRMHLPNIAWVRILHVTLMDGHSSHSSSPFLRDSLVACHLPTHSLSTHCSSVISLRICSTLVLRQRILLVSSIIRWWRVSLMRANSRIGGTRRPLNTVTH